MSKPRFRNGAPIRQNWLGRQDSNLRMPVPKADAMQAISTFLVRNGEVTHTAISMTYKFAAEEILDPIT